ncbi:FAD:protein FMN transferase [Thalassovita aquimarina]|uniref:FAD:protein FMN transferase n=1 Tax=Thalassovita aquimarina TaxID=2785917 RepID=A0ABS5HQY6_9RHOB|nr:FAD:protein FMN transferase [Thalassovita aquimarina]MBR9651399.1 FAD:protein FMN transferase [Thalassovita aquimarina]
MHMKRRRFLSFVSAACLTAAAAPASAFRWQGVALGAKAQIVLDHPEAEPIAAAARAEIARLEQIFSLYRPDSEIMRLNRNGRLEAPSFEMLECLTLARRIHEVTGGLFDPTVQPLWRLLAEAAAAGRIPEASPLKAARALVGFDRVGTEAGRITLAPGQALTLNGIAQGFIADKVAALLAARGVKDVLIDTGEIVAMGAGRGHDGWPVTLRGEDRARLWRDRALASSATFGTVMDEAGHQGHILAPEGSAQVPTEITISAKSAAMADGLSTALCLVANEAEARNLLRSVKQARLERFLQRAMPG